jgi:hypothetical protein
MPISLTCPECHGTFRVADYFAGQSGLCPDCGEIVQVPNDEFERAEPFDDPYSRARRHRRRAAESDSQMPQTHIAGWRRVALGFRLQQVAIVFNLFAMLLFALALIVFPDDPADMEGEPTVPQTVASGFGMLAGVLGLGLQAVGRFLSAATPASAPRIPGWLSAIVCAIQLPAGCGLGLFAAIVAVEQQGQAPDEAMVMLLGLGFFAWLGLYVGGEVLHCFAMGSVGRVLRADGVKHFGRGLAIYAMLAGALAVFALCGVGIAAENENPNGQNPAAIRNENLMFLAWATGAGLLMGLYGVLDLLLLQHGRQAISRTIEESDPEGEREDIWTD